MVVPPGQAMAELCSTQTKITKDLSLPSPVTSFQFLPRLTSRGF